MSVSARNFNGFTERGASGRPAPWTLLGKLNYSNDVATSGAHFNWAKCFLGKMESVRACCGCVLYV